MKTEILAPAGSAASMEAAVSAGADAVYMGGSMFGARAYADNPDDGRLLEVIDYVHLHGRKLYLTVNTLLKDRELEVLGDYLMPYYLRGLDGVIVQDTGVMQYIKRNFPGMPLHVSTQVSVTGEPGAAFFRKAGADRIVPARELSLAEIRRMKEGTGLEIECFVHGAMCYCYSGQCLLSSMIGGRSGNRGQCAQPCRLPWRIQEKKPADLLSLKDLCAVDLLPDLIEAGVDSFKIEGRMKQPEYVHAVVSMYRKYTDLYYEAGREGYHVTEEDRRYLEGAYTRRGYSTGYLRRHNGREMLSLSRPKERKNGQKEQAAGTAEYKIKEKINGKFIFSEGKCATLCLEYKGNKETVQVEASGGPVQAALKAPLEKERLDRQLRKTGDTSFVFDRLDIEMEGKGFLPMQAVNTLRREGLKLLEEEILCRYRRQRPEASQNASARLSSIPAETGTAADVPAEGKFSFQALVQTKEQLLVSGRHKAVETIYVDDGIAFDREVLETVSDLRRKEGKQVLVAMPRIFRERAVSFYDRVYESLLEGYDGVLIRNFEGIQWLKRKRYPKMQISDSNVYVFNRESKDFMKQCGMDGFTYPAELNLRELSDLGGGGILTVYGYQPVMITANCIRKTTGMCTKEDGLLFLTDRQGKKFAVKNICRYCYNVVYNCSPLMLPDMAEEIRLTGPSGIRLDFSIENQKRTEELLILYEKAFLRKEKVGMPEGEYTRGHMKRGVK